MIRTDALICTALRREFAVAARAFRAQSFARYPYRHARLERFGVACSIAQIGVGEHALGGLAWALDVFSPSRVILAGYCGALDPTLDVGHVFTVPQHGQQLETATSADGVCFGPFLCVDRPIVSAAEKRSLRERTGAAAVDMESARAAFACQDRGLSLRVIKVVTDRAVDDVPTDFAGLIDAGGDLRWGALARLLPKFWQWGNLARLAQGARKADGSLAEALRNLDSELAPTPGRGPRT